MVGPGRGSWKAFVVAALVSAGGLLVTPIALAAADAASAGRSSPTRLTAPSDPSVSISSFSPSEGKMGVKVTIVGSGFKGATSVDFHGVQASFTVASGRRITAKVPCGTTSGRIVVHTPNGKARSARPFKIP